MYKTYILENTKHSSEELKSAYINREINHVHGAKDSL